ncbi:helix-turn-helix domain-containing protein [Streptomyces sp. NPDC005483]|uniref:helix-turn-helix domain-containing protein n=1 Tax=Streptomyces sp. NPDC005483 TaxID=3154882 RepID=UPI0033B4D815
MAGRKLKDLPADGSARTQLAQRLRALKRQAGDPTYAEISKRSGYSRAALSGLFNGQVPSREFLYDVVEWLGGKPQEWLEVHEQAQREEEALQHPTDPSNTADELKRARQENAALRLMIANPDDAGYWADRKLMAAAERARTAADTERHARELLSQALAELEHLTAMRADVQERCDVMIMNAMTQAALTEEKARLTAAELIRGAEGTAAELLDIAVVQADRIRGEAQTEISSLHARSGVQVDALLREADLVAADARRETESLKTRARIEIQRMVRDVQETLRRVGQADKASTLEQLLMDFAIGDVHPNDGPSGRHRRTAVPASRPELTA